MRAVQIALLLPEPPLVLLYLVRLRFGRVAPSFFPPLVLAVFPVVALSLSAFRLRGGAVRAAGFEAALVGVAIVELLWAAAGLGIVAFALHSGA